MDLLSTSSHAGIAVALACNFAFGAAAFVARSIDRGGLISGWFVGGLISLCLGLPGFITLAFFFLAGTAATKHGYAIKAARGLAQERGGARSTRNVLANGGVPALLAVSAWAAGRPGWLLVAFAASLATACGDTVSSEIGQLYGKRAFLPTNFKRVPAGTEGAISIEGTLAGIASCAACGLISWTVGLTNPGGAVCVALGGVFGGAFESYLGAVVGKRKLFNNEVMNALNTVVGAGFGAAVYLVLFS